MIGCVSGRSAWRQLRSPFVASHTARASLSARETRALSTWRVRAPLGFPRRGSGGCERLGGGGHLKLERLAIESGGFDELLRTICRGVFATIDQLSASLVVVRCKGAPVGALQSIRRSEPRVPKQTVFPNCPKGHSINFGLRNFNNFGGHHRRPHGGSSASKLISGSLRINLIAQSLPPTAWRGNFPPLPDVQHFTRRHTPQLSTKGMESWLNLIIQLSGGSFGNLDRSKGHGVFHCHLFFLFMLLRCRR